MELETFLQRLGTVPESVTFDETMAVIDAHYSISPTAFRNGLLNNAAGQNNGSCKLFSFARLHGLSQQQTLHCFGKYYRDDVCMHPDGSDHQNIRNFIQTGWAGIEFSGDALSPKQP
ncbi:HopJ type III effector protein [mine drainage metagenome]|uniref:HopJ type III effector protein n=1 Tax=mine drainage metagenome TaxID=410659 RepID=A0A1J5U630_9ZZZZ